MAVALALILNSAATSLRPAMAGPSQATAARGHAWRIAPTPNPDNSAELIDVAGVAGGAWAVGFSLPDTGLAFRTLALFHGGTGWRQIPTVDPDPGFDRLDGLAATAGGNVWAAGSTSAGTLIEHWDGQTWTVVPSRNRPRERNDLADISAAATNDVWAVGVSHAMDDSSASSLIEHWQGNRWRIVPSPDPQIYTALSGVDARASDDAWAVGYAVESSGVGHTVALHWDGLGWTAVPTPSPGLYDNSLADVATLAADDAWAVGNSTDSGVSDRKPLVLHWDGHIWSVVPSPSPYGQLLGIAAAPGGRLLAVGYREDPVLTLVEMWDGSSWRLERSANRPGAIDNILVGLAVDGGPRRTWAVGSSATSDGRLQTLLEQPVAG
jgi:hypothetical protein